MIQENNNVYKEAFKILSSFDKDLLDKIPNNVIEKIWILSTDSEEVTYVEHEKNLNLQNMSEECKDLISLIYYNYIADEDEKKELLKIWNENGYQEKLRQKYNYEDLFKNKAKANLNIGNTSIKENAMIEYKKENLFSKIRNAVKRIFKI